MERVIKLLVEYDNRGRELVQQAQQARLETLARLDEDKRAIQRRCARTRPSVSSRSASRPRGTGTKPSPAARKE